MPKQVYQCVFGIETGDIVRTSRSVGPYQVLNIRGPVYYEGTRDVVIRTWPVIHLTLKDPSRPFRSGTIASGERGINGIRRLEDGRWFTDQNDEVFVQKPHVDRPQVIDMFASPTPEAVPYPFKEGVDYTLEGGVWKCRKCGDFNGQPRHRHGPAYCPVCDWPAYRVALMPPRVLGQFQRSAYQQAHM